MAGKRTPSLIAGVRAAANDVTVTLGALLSMKGGLYSPVVPNAKKEEGFKTACPTCTTPTKPDQKYVCPDCGTQASIGECRKALSDYSAFVTAEDIAEAKKSDLDEKFLALTVHRRADIEDNTFPGEKTWIFRPGDKSGQMLYSLLVSVLPRLEYALVGQINLGQKMGEKFVRLTVENGEVVLQELVRPEDRLDLPEAETIEVPAASETMVVDLVKELAEDFEPDAYRNQARERIIALKATANGGTAPTPTRTAPKPVDLTTALEAALAAAKSKAS